MRNPARSGAGEKRSGSKKLSGSDGLEELFQSFLIRQLRRYCRLVLILDGLIEFVPVNRNMRRCFDSDANMIPADMKHLDFDLVPDDDLLANFPRDYKHRAP